MKALAVAASLSGLCLDLIGAFLLAAEAIGLATIRAWKEGIVDRPAYILASRRTVEIERRAKEHSLGWLPGVAVGVASGLGSGIGSLIAKLLEQAGSPSWLPWAGLLIGAAAGAFTLDGTVWLLRASSRFLAWVEESAGKGTIGMMGFLLLAAGFLMQFVGTLAQALTP